MGNSIDPRIALGVQVPQIEGPIDLQRGALSVQQLINATQLQKQQQASAAIAQQQQQIDLENQQQQQKDTLSFNKAYRDAGGDWDQTIKNATTAGVSGTFLTQKQIARADLIAKTAATTKVQRENDETKITALAKDADTLLKTDPQDRPSLYNSMVNAHVLNGNGAYKITDFPATVPSEAQLQDIVSHSKAVQDIHAEAAKLAETNAKLPGEQAEAQAKRLATAAQTMNGALNQIAWTARRNYLAKSDPEMAQQIPENYSPEAAEQVKQMGISPEKQFAIPEGKIELADFMKNPPKGYKPTPTEFLRYQKSIAPILNMQIQTSGGGLGPSGGVGGGGAGTATNVPAPANAPGGWATPSGKTLNNVPPQIRGEVQQVLEYRRPDPSITQRGLVGQAINQWVADLDPQHDASTFPAKNKILTDFTKDASTGQIGSINTALGHLGELNAAAKALNQNDIPLIHSIASSLGLATGGDAESTYNLILHKVGPEITNSYIKSGGTQGERGTNEDDFALSKGAQQIQSNIAESANLFNSKLASKKQDWEATFRPYRDADQFDNRFLTPAAKKTLQDLSAQAPTNKSQYTPPAGAKTATNPANGHKINVDGGKWVDSKTGAPI